MRLLRLLFIGLLVYVVRELWRGSRVSRAVRTVVGRPDVLERIENPSIYVETEGRPAAEQVHGTAR